jgi:amino acid transporter
MCAFLAIFSLPQLIAVYMWVRVATSVLTLLAVWRLRYTAPDMPRPFRIPGGTVGIAAVVVVPLCLFAWALINGDKSALFWGPAYMAVGPVSYLLLRTRFSKEFAAAD